MLMVSFRPIDQQISDEAYKLFLRMEGTKSRLQINEASAYFLDKPMLKLLENIRKPFEELRFTTFSILAAISQYSWGKRV